MDGFLRGKVLNMNHLVAKINHLLTTENTENRARVNLIEGMTGEQIKTAFDNDSLIYIPDGLMTISQRSCC